MIIADLQRFIGELSGGATYITTKKDGLTIAVLKLPKALSGIVRLSANAFISSVIVFGDASKEDRLSDGRVKTWTRTTRPTRIPHRTRARPRGAGAS
jgi:hypothetical protein